MGACSPCSPPRRPAADRCADWAYEVKWDGMRVLADVQRRPAPADQPRSERDVTVAFPELAGLAEAPPGRAARRRGGRPGRTAARRSPRSPSGCTCGRAPGRARWPRPGPVTLHGLRRAPAVRRRPARPAAGGAPGDAGAARAWPAPHWQVLAGVRRRRRAAGRPPGSTGWRAWWPSGAASRYQPGRAQPGLGQAGRTGRSSPAWSAAGARRPATTGAIGAAAARACPHGAGRRVLRFAGRVGSGHRRRPAQRDLLTLLRPPLAGRRRRSSTQVPPEDAAGATGCEPRAWSSRSSYRAARTASRLRSPAFRGVRPDLDAGGPVRCRSEPVPPSAQVVEVEGRRLALCNLDKVLYPRDRHDQGRGASTTTRRIAPVLLPHLRDRPVTRMRWPNGVDGRAVLREEHARAARRTGSARVRLPAPGQRRTARRSTTSSSTTWPRWSGWPTWPRSSCTCRSGRSARAAASASPTGWSSTSTRGPAAGLPRVRRGRACRPRAARGGRPAALTRSTSGSKGMQLYARDLRDARTPTPCSELRAASSPRTLEREHAAARGLPDDEDPAARARCCVDWSQNHRGEDDDLAVLAARPGDPDGGRAPVPGTSSRRRRHCGSSNSPRCWIGPRKRGTRWPTCSTPARGSPRKLKSD